MKDSFDIVVVPDFVGSKSFAFELRTLFFLASWSEYSGEARTFPLHLACVGEPPASVRWLSEKVGADITVHAPILAENRGFANKLRGFEVRQQTSRLLLLDADIMVFGDLSGLAQREDQIMVSIDTNARVSEIFWQRIYASQNMVHPDKVPSLRSLLNLPNLRKVNYPSQEVETKSMTPYYNTGVIFTPWDCALLLLWMESTRHITKLFSQEVAGIDGDLGPVTGCDQAGFALAAEKLRQQGTRVEQLPYEFHSHWLHLYRRTTPASKIKIFHAFRFGNDVQPDNCEQLISNYTNFLKQRLRSEWKRNDHGTPLAYIKYLLPALADVSTLGNRMQKLWRNYVKPALAKNS